MLPRDQEKLFALVLRRFSNWSTKKASGYVHGVVLGLQADNPNPIKPSTSGKSYLIGFYYGFLDAYGEDALDTKWARRLELSRRSIAYRWWSNV